MSFKTPPINALSLTLRLGTIPSFHPLFQSSRCRKMTPTSKFETSSHTSNLNTLLTILVTFEHEKFRASIIHYGILTFTPLPPSKILETRHENETLPNFQAPGNLGPGKTLHRGTISKQSSVLQLYRNIFIGIVCNENDAIDRFFLSRQIFNLWLILFSKKYYQEGLRISKCRIFHNQ